MMAKDIVLTIIGRDRASEVFDRVAASATASASKMDRASAAMVTSGARLTRGLTVPIVAIGAVSLKMASDFQKSMTLLQTAGGESAKNMTLVANGIKQTAVQTGTSLKALSDGMYIAEKAGLRGANGLTVLKAAAEGAKAENVDLGTAMTALTSVMMSYHLSAKQAVSVENMLVAGAGKAKTTMQEYAGALSTVIPIASAAHIRFAQVAGAIATLTQHGTDAREATQELSSTIRNLLSPNQVAQKSMQQLGLSVNDVSTHLGKRGLTGTIDLITNTIGKHLGPAGTVVVSAFKKSQSATQDLNVELAHMPKSLADISKQFESGQLSYKDYNKAVKALGGDQYVLGKNFISTMAQAKGFNNLLTSGQPAALTFAAYLKQIMGGAIGMNTALQLGGENMRYFSRASADVAAAGAKAGANISTWAKTQATLAVQADKAKAAIEVMAVNIGQMLLPVALNVVKAVQGMVSWFSHLSSGTQSTIVKVALLAAALGPVLVLVGRLSRALVLLGRAALGLGAGVVAMGRFVGGMRAATLSMEGMTATSYLAGRNLRGMFQTLGTTGVASVRTLGAVVAGAGIGLALGQITKHADTTTKVLGTLGSTAAGAAIGLAVGGPLGAAIGGLSGLVTSLVTNFLHTGSAAQSGAKQAAAAMKQQQADAQDLLSVLQSVNGAYSAQYRQSIVSKLGKSGGLDVLSRLGMNSPNTISTILGQNGPRALANLYASIENEAAAGRIDYKSMNLLVGAIQHLSPAAAAAEKQFEEQSQAMHGGVLAANQLNARYNNLRAIFRLTGSTLDDVSAAGLHNRAALTQIAQASNTAAVKAIEHGKAVGQTTMAYEGQQNQLRFNLEALGFQSKAVEDLIGKYKLTPTQIVTKLVADARAGIGTSREYQNIIDSIRQHKVPGLNANAGQGKSIIADLQRRIDLLRGKTVDININTNYRQYGVHPSTGGTQFFAGGGTVAGGIPGRDSVPIMAMPGEEIIPTRQANKYRALLKAIAAGAKGFASGGTVGGTSLMSMIERAGFRGRAAATMYGIVMAESGGNAHALNNNPRTGDLSYGLAQINMIGGLGPSRRRAFHLSSDSALYDPLTNLRVAYSLSGHGRNFSPWTTYTSGAFRHYATGAPSVTLSGSSGASSGAAAHRAAVAAAAVQARNQRISTTVGGASTAISAVNGVPGSPRFDPNNFSETAFRWQVRAANASIQVAKAAGASAATLKKLTDRLREYTKQGELTYLQQQKARLLAPINARLASVRQASAQLGSSVSSAVLGGFDITSMGQVYNDQPATASSIKDAAWAVFKNAQKFVAVLKTLRKEGLGAGLVAQLAQAGPAALPQAEALAKGTPAQLKSITSAYAGLHTLAGQAAGVATDYAYGGQIKNLEQQQKNLAEAIGREVAKVMAKHPTQITISGLADIDAAIKALERRLAARV
jgi:TP901 family phage tail tape measure protein